MGNTNSTESSIHQRTRSKSDSSSVSVANTIEITPPPVTEKTPNTPQLSITEPHSEETSLSEKQPTETSKAVPVATGKSGWVSSTTGAASPWFNSLSSSTSSYHPHRASISGPYYRTRGMSVTRDSENDDDPNTPTSTTLQANASTASSEGVPTIITWTQGGNNVYVTGTFNGWKHKIKLIKSTHDFNAVLELPPGTHRLKFIVDDEWKCSSELETATDPDGNLVNYLQVMDDEEEEDDDDDLTSTTGSTHDDYYSNTIPPELLKLAEASEGDLQTKPSIEWEKKQPQPPTLPPHLDKVLLNSQTVSEEDNSVLYEPNHVTLNHLYACSIKDNVMALATTTRYRKKYVTTMYYRPVSPKD